MSYGGSWDHSKVRDFHILHNTATEDAEPLHEKDSEGDIEGTWQWNITKGLAIRMSSIGVPRITADNIEMVFLRLRQTDILLGCVLYKWNEDEGKSEDYHITMEDVARRVGLWATTDKNLTDAGFGKRVAAELAMKVGRETHNERVTYTARQLILTLTAGDEWDEGCQKAARTIGLDPDNYRLIDTNKVTFDTGQSILDHYDAIPKCSHGQPASSCSMCERKERFDKAKVTA